MFKIIRVSLVLVLMVIFTAGCNTETIKHHDIFTGEGSMWSAEYVQDVTEKIKPKVHETSKNYVFKLKYKGDSLDLAVIKQFKYSFKGTAGGESRSQDGPVKLADLKFSHTGSTGSYEREDSIIRVEVEWDGQKEQFELRKDPLSNEK